MKNNSIKSNYSIDEIHRTLHPKGKLADWDGLTNVLLQLVDKDKARLKDSYIKSRYTVSVSCLSSVDCMTESHAYKASLLHAKTSL